MSHLVSIREFAATLDPIGSRWCAFAMLKAYFDESGSYADDPVSALAGYIGTEAQWREIEHKWTAILREFAREGVKTFHMSHALRQEREFSKLEKPFINRVFMELGKILSDAHIMSIFSAVINEDWNAVVRDKAFLARFPKPLDLCFDDIVRQMCEWAHCHAGGERVVPIFAHNHEFDHRFQTIYASYVADPWYQSALDSLAFDYPERVVPLQCADYVANRTRDEIEVRRYDPLRGASLAYKMAVPGYHNGHWFRADTLCMTVQRWRETGEIYSVARS